MPPQELYREGSICYSGGEYQDEVFKYRLLVPAKIEAGQLYPLVLFLHGAGERGDDNVRQLTYLPSWISRDEMREKYPCFLIAPQCHEDKTWVQVRQGAPQSLPMTEPTEEMNVVLRILDEVSASNPIDPKRIYLTGISMGGYAAWDLAMREPKRFAAVAPICGGGDEREAHRLVGTCVWAWHGEKDEIVPVERSRDMVTAIALAGGDPKYTELKGVGHDSWTPAYTDPDGVIPWLFRQSQ